MTRREELIMLSILNLKQNAYLVAIKDHLSSITRTPISLTSIFIPLTRLEKQGLLCWEFGESSAIRGGRRKKIYKLTHMGLKELQEYKRINDVLWIKYSELASRKNGD